MSWEQAKEKEKECASTENEGFWLSHQVRNGKKTAILAILDEQGKKTKKGKEGGKLFFVYRPNTGQQVKQETLAELKKKYKNNKEVKRILRHSHLPKLLIKQQKQRQIKKLAKFRKDENMRVNNRPEDRPFIPQRKADMDYKFE